MNTGMVGMQEMDVNSKKKGEVQACWTKHRRSGTGHPHLLKPEEVPHRTKF